MTEKRYFTAKCDGDYCIFDSDDDNNCICVCDVEQIAEDTCDLLNDYELQLKDCTLITNWYFSISNEYKQLKIIGNTSLKKDIISLEKENYNLKKENHRLNAKVNRLTDELAICYEKLGW